MPTLEEAKKTYYALKEKEDALREAEAIEKNTKLIGSCWRYRNGNGTEYWWLYARVIAVDKQGVILEHVQPIGGYQGSEFSHRHYWTNPLPWPDGSGGNWTRITSGEYNRAIAPILRALGIRKV